jgi:diacylglycerol kinase family enzyme
MDKKTAVLLNQNARKVTPKLINQLQEAAPDADFYVTKTLEEGNQALKQIAKGRYKMLFTGGGDGTICHAITQLNEKCQNKKMPTLGILPLGTGNAIASFLESPPAKDCIPASIYAQKESLSFAHLEHENGNTQAAFGGFGWDAFILDRYYRWRNFCKQHTLLKPLSEGLGAYLLSGLGWAVPAMAVRPPRWYIKVYSGDNEAWQLDELGQKVKYIAPQSLMYEGYAQFCSFGTCPYFGYRLKALPFAALQNDSMHIRIADVSPIIPALHLKSLWQGTFNHDRVHDFLAKDFRVELSDQAAIQMGGDIVGHLDHLDVSMSKPTSMLRYAPYPGLRLPYEQKKHVA